VNDQSYLEGSRVRREVRDLLQAELGVSLTVENLAIEAEKFLSREPNGSSYRSLDFSLVLKLLYMCGGSLTIASNSDYRQCQLNGGADLHMKQIELIYNDFDQILARLRSEIEMERSIDCNCPRRDHVCKPIYQLTHLKDIQKMRETSGLELTFDQARTMLASICYELSISFNGVGKVRKRLAVPHARRKAS